MTKRPYPFEPNICRQTKIHFNNFENDIVTLRNVEEQTLKKLKEGSKKLFLMSSKEENFLGFENAVREKNNYIQKCVTNYFTVNGKKSNESNRIIIVPFETPNKCFFCETKADSVQQCAKCFEYYCSSCSFVSYESSEDYRICLSCS